MARSFWNRILRVDLTHGITSITEPGALYWRRYMGGWNVIADILLREVPIGADPLGPDNRLVFAPGILTGLALSGASRNAVGARSPLTGAFGAAEVGGGWGAELKHAGFDAIIVEGCAPRPAYMLIRNGSVELRDASHLWGLRTKETWDALRTESGEERLRVAMIGPGGENLVRFACVMNETKDAAGRTGMGAVMGSKRLKAIAVRGTLPLEAADPAKVRELARWMGRGVASGQQAENLHKWGTGINLEEGVLTGNLPIRNFRDGEFAAAADISANRFHEKLGAGMEGCWACAIRCKKVVRTQQPYEVDTTYGGPEYESIASLGSCCGVGDPQAICKANELCNAYSLDTISVGVTVAFAMECYERGLLSSHEVDGLDLRFGNGDALIAAIERIAHRAPGLGSLLADGVRVAAQRIGQGSEAFAMHVKGQELPMHEPRLKRGLAIGYAVSPTGADHCHSLHDMGLVNASDEGMLKAGFLTSVGVVEPMPIESLGPEKVRAAIYHTLGQMVNNCLPVCLFVPWSLEQKAELVRAATGWDVSAHELMKLGERALALAKTYDVREGFSRLDDVLPERSYGPTANGALAQGGIGREGLDQAVRTFYEMLGWDSETGQPLPSTLHELGVGWVTEHLPR